MRQVLLAAVATAGLLAASHAHAAIIIMAEANLGSGYFTVGTVTDDGVGDGALGIGQVSAIFSNPTVGININTALGDPTLPQPGFSITANAGTFPTAPPNMLLRLSFTQTDVTVNSGSLASDFALVSLLGAGAGVTIASFVDDGNVAFGLTTPLASHVFLSSGQFSSDNATPVTGTYSQTIQMTMLFTGGVGSLNAGAQLSAIPEPTTLAIFGLSLVGLGLASRRRRGTA